MRSRMMAANGTIPMATDTVTILRQRLNPMVVYPFMAPRPKTDLAVLMVMVMDGLMTTIGRQTTPSNGLILMETDMVIITTTRLSQLYSMLTNAATHFQITQLNGTIPMEMAGAIITLTQRGQNIVIRYGLD